MDKPSASPLQSSTGHSPQGAPNSTTISALINIATRKQHTELNRLIIQRLPLALPPHSKTSLLFSRGWVPFARIILLFEVEWEVLARHVERGDVFASSAQSRETRAWLTSLRPDGLVRTPRIRSDMHHLRFHAGSQIFNTVPLGERWSEEMRALVRQKPHLFIAFAWVFYMAIFSGGRWIRQQLADAGPDFWSDRVDEDAQKSATSLPGFSFLAFDGDADGEDIKAAFKSRLLEAEKLLSPEQKREVVVMSERLFDRCIEIVSELDRKILREQIWKRLQPFMKASFGLVLALILYWLLQR